MVEIIRHERNIERRAGELKKEPRSPRIKGQKVKLQGQREIGRCIKVMKASKSG